MTGVRSPHRTPDGEDTVINEAGSRTVIGETNGQSAGRAVTEPARIVDGPKPKHVQLREILRKLIDNELPPGSPIPSERELADRYGVSRLTVRSAVARLEIGRAHV